MTLQTFLFTLFGKQEKGGEREDKKLEMEILQEIGMQRFVHFHFKLAQSNLYPICLLFSAFLNLDTSLSLHACRP